MSPRGFLDISKIYGRQHNWYFILNSDEKIQQSKAIEYYEKLKDIKFKMFMNKNFRHESS